VIIFFKPFTNAPPTPIKKSIIKAPIRAPERRDGMSMLFFMAPTLPTPRLIEEGFLREGS